MVTINKLAAQNSDKYLKISVRSEQEVFSGKAADIIESHFVAGYGRYLFGIDSDGRAAGIFTVHDASDEIVFGEKMERAAVLKGFMIDKSMQGRGYGGAAVTLLIGLISDEYEQLYLTVNLKNLNAIHAYTGMGFIDSGELYTGGPAGPQKIMYLDMEKRK